MSSEKEKAVLITNLRYNYENDDNKVVLKNVSVDIPQGSIYGLLGPSGCGKTTLLKCIIGRLKPSSGVVRTLGHNPFDKNVEIQNIIGYMPQEIALFIHFTIKELLSYFCQIYGMKNQEIKARIEFLAQFFGLPKLDSLIKQLSDGQKRRVSLAAAFVHNPRLVILDEPTVGIDPILRERIWDYLVITSRNENTTILITTHYVEEASRANKVAFLRNGELLAEDTPQNLVERYNTPLEKVFLLLCSQLTEVPPDNILDENKTTLSFSNKESVKSKNGPKLLNMSKKSFDGAPPSQNMLLEGREPSVCKKLKALIFKNVTQTKRNISALLFNLILPALTVMLFCVCVGDDASDIKIAVFNQETANITNDTDPDELLSLKILKEFEKERIILEQHNSEESAIKAVKNGDVWGAVVIGDDFSNNLMDRLLAEPFYSVSNETISASTIHFYGDMTNYVICQHIVKRMLEGFLAFGRKKLNRLKDANVEALETPLKIEKPIYGEKIQKFKTFAASGLIALVLSLLSLILTTLTFVEDRQDGLWERDLVAGVRPYQLFVAHCVVQVMLLVIQVILALICMYCIFAIPCRGSAVLLVALSILQGFLGVTFGFLTSACCRQTRTALMISLGSFFPSMILSGVLWPLEAMPTHLRNICLFQPLALSVQASRAITLRGWGLTHFTVYFGFLATIAWILIFIIITIIVMKVRS